MYRFMYTTGMEELKNLKIGCAPMIIGGIRIHVKRPTNGCKGCVFGNEDGAEDCRMKEYCMAHCRPDRTPVIFVME